VYFYVLQHNQYKERKHKNNVYSLGFVLQYLKNCIGPQYTALTKKWLDIHSYFLINKGAVEGLEHVVYVLNVRSSIPSP
jgi:hypothetical protein